MDEPQVRSLEEAEQHIRSLTVNVRQLQQARSDFEQRRDTWETPWWKRIWFWIDGWPWYDLNAPQRRWRPWH